MSKQRLSKLQRFILKTAVEKPTVPLVIPRQIADEYYGKRTRSATSAVARSCWSLVSKGLATAYKRGFSKRAWYEMLHTAGPCKNKEIREGWEKEYSSLQEPMEIELSDCEPGSRNRMFFLLLTDEGKNAAILKVDKAQIVSSQP